MMKSIKQEIRPLTENQIGRQVGARVLWQTANQAGNELWNQAIDDIINRNKSL